MEIQIACPISNLPSNINICLRIKLFLQTIWSNYYNSTFPITLNETFTFEKVSAAIEKSRKHQNDPKFMLRNLLEQYFTLKKFYPNIIYMENRNGFLKVHPKLEHEIFIQFVNENDHNNYNSDQTVKVINIQKSKKKLNQITPKSSILKIHSLKRPPMLNYLKSPKTPFKSKFQNVASRFKCPQKCKCEKCLKPNAIDQNVVRYNDKKQPIYKNKNSVPTPSTKKVTKKVSWANLVDDSNDLKIAGPDDVFKSEQKDEVEEMEEPHDERFCDICPLFRRYTLKPYWAHHVNHRSNERRYLSQDPSLFKEETLNEHAFPDRGLLPDVHNEGYTSTLSKNISLLSNLSPTTMKRAELHRLMKEIEDS
ncbi:uncharacterized protein LOC135928830 [Gordionus sp. m RMFG-2023]|uniref:uncharacterized protein LOC135928830 n=1 Tax=Gordionus sp. m RMFG-2023 TaxID=3053472 RepID=UPI0031FDEA31